MSYHTIRVEAALSVRANACRDSTHPLAVTFEAHHTQLADVARQCMEVLPAEQVRDLLRTHFAEYLLIDVKP